MNSEKIGKLSDRELLAEVRLMNDATIGDEGSFSLNAAMSGELKTELTGFAGELDAYDGAQVAEDAAVQAKNTRRKKILTLARQQMKLIRATPEMTDEKLAEANLDAYDKTKTASSAPTTAPVGWVDYGKLKHTIYFRDSATPDSEAKPKGMKGCEIWRFVGDGEPASEADYDFVALDSGSPYTAFYTMADAGKKVRYLLRWVSTGDEKGEWSETIEATING
jgi:hypothetical protein